MKKRVISLLLCLLMALSLIPTAAFASDVATQDKNNGHEDDKNTPHIDVNINIDVEVNGQKMSLSLERADLANLTITNTNGVTFTQGKGFTLDGTSYDNSGNLQFRLVGDFLYGTKNAPVDYTLTLKKTVGGVPFEFTATVNKWSKNNVCPGKDDNAKGIDVAFGTASKVEGVLQVTKVIDIDNAALEANKEFTFTVTNKADNSVAKTITIKTTGTETTLSKTVSLPNGTYVVTETTAASYTDYNPASVSYKVGTTETNDKAEVAITVGQTTTVTVTNKYEKKEQEPEIGFLKISKVLEDNAPDAAKNMNFKFKILDKDGNQWGDIITITGAGSSSISVPVGNYTVVEVNGKIDGYILTTTTVYGEPTGVSTQSNDPDAATDTPKAVVENNNTTEVTVTNKYTKLTMGDGYETASMTVEKVDSKDNSIKLSGVEFTLYLLNDKNERELVKTLTTDKNGKCKFESLMPGTYELVETKTINGYVLDSTPKTFTVTTTSREQLVTDTDGVKKFQTVYECKIGGARDVTLVVENEKTTAPVDYTVTIPVTKQIKVGTGSSKPTSIPNFNFVAYLGNKEVGKLEFKNMTDNKNDTYSGTLTVKLTKEDFASATDNTLVLTIKETGSTNYWTYDSNFYTVTVKLDNGGSVKYSVDLNGKTTASAVVFVNTYNYSYTPGPGPKPNPKPTPKPVTSVKTGDMGIALYAMTSLLSLGGTALVIKKRKDEE